MLQDITNITRRIPINTDLDIIVARLRVREVARDMGFGTIDQARISLAASELARLLTQIFGHPGEILVSSVKTDGHWAIQVVSVATHNLSTATAKAIEADDLFSYVMNLVDDGHIDASNGRSTSVTLMKWVN